LAIPVTRPPPVTVATAGASESHPDVMLCVCPPARVSVPEACAVCPIRSGLDTVTATAVVVDDDEVGDPEESLSPQAATVANPRTINTRRITSPDLS
jgi:hypothetical protein